MPPYDKLIRDKIPEVIAKNNQQAEIRTLNDDEFAWELEKKLQEEVGEYLQDKSPEELADILEVVFALGELQGYGQSQLERLRTQKAQERGGFKKKLFLVRVDG
jgi:predicted house-cleaning noncanonical NTP pyrophosphatase (MazG superfamily)